MLVHLELIDLSFTTTMLDELYNDFMYNNNIVNAT